MDDDLVEHRPLLGKFDVRTSGFFATLVHPRVLASVLLYVGMLWGLTLLLDVVTPIWLVGAFILGGLSLPWGFLGAVRARVESMDFTPEDPAVIEEHDIRTSPPVGVPDDLSSLSDIPDLSDLEDEFDVRPEPEQETDSD